MNRCCLVLLIVAFGSAGASRSHSQVPSQSQATSPAQTSVLSHPPLRLLPPVSKRPLSPGRAYFVDVKLGSDEGSGLEDRPWRTIAYALKQLRAGSTLYLRAGTYYEQLSIALQGSANSPITIRSYPGEQAIIDGSLQEFTQSPEQNWKPVPRPGEMGVTDEYWSTKSYPNLRDVIGYFGDSNIGLQTYWHRQDLLATSETFTGTGGKGATDKDVDPIYLGPGLWYDKRTGHIHCRLAHTKLPAPPAPHETAIANYRGETDPRKLPLTIAAYRSTPLFFDQAEHVILEDLVIRGGGYVTVLMEQSQHIRLTNCTIFAGTYGLRAVSTSHLVIQNCGFYGSLAPWTFRSDASKRDYPGRPHRNLSRLNTHALIEVDAGRESSVWAYPQNDRWSISQSHFTDSHDGLYLGAIDCDFHRNIIENMQDDGIYLSPMYQRHKLDDYVPQIVIHDNLFRQVLTALAFGGNEPNTHDQIVVYRNVFDLRQPILAARMSETRPEPTLTTGKLIGDHGSPPWSSLYLAHNTVIASGSRDALMASGSSATAERPKRVFNNLFVHTDRLPAYLVPAAGANLISDGNLFWSPAADEKTTAAFFKKWQASPSLTENKKSYEAGNEAASLVADPKLDGYQLTPGSPAINAGIELNSQGRDHMRGDDTGRPDIGAIPAGVKMYDVGRFDQNPLFPKKIDE